MATEIRVPTLGESVTEATVGKWFKQPGDAVKADEPLLELETDKVTLEVNAPAAGTLGEILAKAGETVGVGAVLGSIEAGSGAPKAEAAKVDTRPAPPGPASLATSAAAETVAAPAPKGPSPMPPSPSAQKIAADRAIDVGGVGCSGRRGQVLKEDVLRAEGKPAPSAPAAAPAPQPATAPAPAPPPAAPRPPSPADDAAREERVRMTKLRQTIARRLKEAQANAAML